jgi:hypothetical protein
VWFLLQSSIIFAVCASNIHWHWTPNGYIPSLLGIGLAYLATLMVQRIMFKGALDEAFNTRLNSCGI